MNGGKKGKGKKKKVDNEKLYKVLGVKKDVTTDDIKKRFKLLARNHHPDRGGDAEKFKEIRAAYEILTDPEKREVYDEYGIEGLREMEDMKDMEDIFQNMGHLGDLDGDLLGEEGEGEEI